MKIFLSLNLLDMVVEKRKWSPTGISAAKGRIRDIWVSLNGERICWQRMWKRKKFSVWSATQSPARDQSLMLLPRLFVSPVGPSKLSHLGIQLLTSPRNLKANNEWLPLDDSFGITQIQKERKQYYDKNKIESHKKSKLGIIISLKMLLHFWNQ